MLIISPKMRSAYLYKLYNVNRPPSRLGCYRRRKNLEHQKGWEMGRERRKTKTIRFNFRPAFCAGQKKEPGGAQSARRRGGGSGGHEEDVQELCEDAGHGDALHRVGAHDGDGLPLLSAHQHGHLA